MIKAWAMAVCLGVCVLSIGANAFAQKDVADSEVTFFSECTSSGAEAALCQCVWSGVEARMTPDEYQALDAAMRSQRLHSSMGKYELIVGECNGTSRVTASNPEAYPGHLSANFMRACVGGGVSEAICACTMNAAEREMSVQTFAELDHMFSWNRPNEHPAYQRFSQIVQQCARENP